MRSAVWAGRLGIASVLLFPAPFAVAVGLWGGLELRRNRSLRGWPNAIAGLVLGTLGCLGMALLNPSSAPLVFLALYIGFAASGVGWVHGCVLASKERPMWGFLAAVIPIFWIWYCVSRWNRCWPNLILVVVGYPLIAWAMFQA